MNTLQTLPQGTFFQHFRQGSFERRSLAMESKGKPLIDSIKEYFKKL